MRLDDFDNDIEVGDQRGQGGGFGFGGGGGGGGMLLRLLPFVFSRFGCGGVAVLLAVMFFFSGGLPLLSGGAGDGAGDRPVASAPGSGGGVAEACRVDAASKAACDAFSSANRTWRAIFARSGQAYDPPMLQFYAGSGRSGCGAAQSAMGPFYCPGDQGIYLDTSFFDELGNRFGARGDFAQFYVMAHEFGHHVQNLTGISAQVQRAQRRVSEREGNALSVRLELQADCYAGVWGAINRDRLDPGDVEEGLTAANAIGDDTLQRQAQGRVVPDSFTHGSSADRIKWLKRGLETGDPAQCDTFSGGI